MKTTKWKRILAMMMVFSMSVTMLFLGGFTKTAQAAEADAETVVFVHTNDVHGYVSVEPYVKSIADSFKAQYGDSNVITASAGDVFAGGVGIAHLTKGEAIVDIMNAAGYDVMTFGNNDLNMGGSQLLHLSTETNFPILAANWFARGTDTSTELAASYADGDQPLDGYTIFTTEDGTKIGVFGLTTVMPADNPTGSYYYTTGTIETAQKYVDLLKEQEDCDIVVALTHTGWPDNDETMTATSSNDTNSYQLAMTVDGIDLIIDGHTHSVIGNGVGYTCDNDSHTLVVQTGSFGANVGVVELTIEDGQIQDKTAFQYSQANGDFDNITPDSAVEAVVEKWEDNLASITGEEIGTTDYYLNGDRASASSDGKGIRRAEENLGNLVTDAIRNATGADVALFGGVRIRSAIAAGTITKGDLYNVFANGGDVYTQEMTGEELIAKLESSIASACKNSESPTFNQISGMQFVYDASTGKVVSATMADGTLLDETAVYTVALDSNSASDDMTLQFSGYEELVAMLKAYIQSDQYDTNNYSGPEGRIVELSDLENRTIPVLGTPSATITDKNNASLTATVETGSEEISAAGFEYTGADGTISKVYGTMENGVISAQITGLEYDADYVVKAFVRTATGYTYSEEETVTTEPEYDLNELAKEIIVSPSNLKMYTKILRGSTAEIELSYPEELQQFIDDGKISQQVTYKSSNSKVVGVTSEGTLCAKRTGRAVITTTVTLNNTAYIYTSTVYVSSLPVEYYMSSTRVTPSFAYLKTGQTQQIQISLSKAMQELIENGMVDYSVSYESSNQRIATVSANGTITAKKDGFAGILTKIKVDGKIYYDTTWVNVHSMGGNNQIIWQMTGCHSVDIKK